MTRAAGMANFQNTNRSARLDITRIHTILIFCGRHREIAYNLQVGGLVENSLQDCSYCEVSPAGDQRLHKRHSRRWGTGRQGRLRRVSESLRTDQASPPKAHSMLI